MATGTPAHEFRELDNAELETRLKDANLARKLLACTAQSLDGGGLVRLE